MADKNNTIDMAFSALVLATGGGVLGAKIGEPFSNAKQDQVAADNANAPAPENNIRRNAAIAGGLLGASIVPGVGAVGAVKRRRQAQEKSDTPSL